jgi:hypothetical protein
VSTQEQRQKNEDSSTYVVVNPKTADLKRRCKSNQLKIYGSASISPHIREPAAASCETAVCPRYGNIADD